MTVVALMNTTNNPLIGSPYWCCIWQHIPLAAQQPCVVNQTLAGNPAKFNYQRLSNDLLRVWGTGGRGGSYDFTLTHDQFVMICLRYRTADAQRNMTSHYNPSKWSEAPCGVRNTPAVPPVIHDLWSKCHAATCALNGASCVGVTSP